MISFDSDAEIHDLNFLPRLSYTEYHKLNKICLVQWLMPPARKAIEGLLFSLSGGKGQGGERGEGNARVLLRSLLSYVIPLNCIVHPFRASFFA